MNHNTQTNERFESSVQIGEQFSEINVSFRFAPFDNLFTIQGTDLIAFF